MHYRAIVWQSLACVLLTGCAPISGIMTESRIDGVIADYHRLAPQMHIGDTKEKVSAILGPLQDRLNPNERKASQAFQRDGKLVEILYFRTQRIPDNMTTDDEFTPYVFIDGKLQAFGWSAFGIPITRVSNKNRTALTQLRPAENEPAMRSASGSESESISAPGLLPNGLLSPYKPNAYGPGINSDATGRPFSWQPQGSGPQSFDPFLKVKPNAYGPGIGMDQYSRPVRPACPPGWAGPC
jgi:hypothetical protein